MDIRDGVEGTEVNHDDLSYHNYEKEDPYMESSHNNPTSSVSYPDPITNIPPQSSSAKKSVMFQ